MGGQNPDRAIMPPSPLTAVTLGRMAALRWEMRAQCNRCGVALHVDVNSLVRLHGPNVIWWGRQPRCRRLLDGFRCRGRVTFHARATLHGSWQSMRTPISARDRELGLLRELGQGASE